MITIIDYGLGNLGSIKNMFKRIGVASQIVNEPSEVLKADKLLLPGVGKFDAAMRRINETGLRDVLEVKVKGEQVPLLGICLGMQLLTKGSEEGDLPGFGWIDAETKKFSATQGLKVPHMGWNIVSRSRNAHPIVRALPDDSRFYFVHSYYVKVASEEDSLLKANYGSGFDAGICRESVFGVQFHPEKSHRFGMALFKSFAEL